MDFTKLFKDLEEAQKKWKLSNEQLAQLSKLWNLTVETRVQDVNNDELNALGKNYADNANKTAAAKKSIEFDAAKKQTDIEKAASAIKEKRSDITREELLKETNEYRDKQDRNYATNQEILDTQKRIANRQANMEVASAWRYWDVYSDWAVANIKNDVINKYWDNISAAQQAYLANNRNIDADLLNVWYKEVDDKNARDTMKDSLLDKENSYTMNAIREWVEADKKAVTDVETLNQAAIKNRVDDTLTRSGQTQKREFYEKEFASLNKEWKAQMLRDHSYNIQWYSMVSDYIPRLIQNYPNLSLSELKAKVEKIAEYALSQKQLLTGKVYEQMSNSEKKNLDYMMSEWYNRLSEANRTYPTTIDANNSWENDKDWNNHTYNTNDNTEKDIKNEDINKSIDLANNERASNWNTDRINRSQYGTADNRATNNLVSQYGGAPKWTNRMITQLESDERDKLKVFTESVIKQNKKVDVDSVSAKLVKSFWISADQAYKLLQWINNQIDLNYKPWNSYYGNQP